MKQKMVLVILISLAFAFRITIGCKKKGMAQTVAIVPPITVAPPELVKDCFTCDTVPEGTIFCDDFESEAALADRYFEYDNDGGDFVRVAKSGRGGSAGMRVVWQQGETAAGSLKKSFGRTPDKYIGTHAAFPEEDFKEIYWRIDIKRQAGWEGGVVLIN